MPKRSATTPATTPTSPAVDDARLRATLDTLTDAADLAAHRANDPVERVWMYATPEDQALAALVASAVAYGRVKLVRDAGRRILEPLGPAPMETLRALSAETLHEWYRDFVYRMTRGEDVIDLLWSTRTCVARYGSLEATYLAGGDAEPDHLSRASGFVRRLRDARLREDLSRGLRYLLPDPADGSACKRLHLFFRWVGRGPDEIDLGIWESLPARDLIMPVDTHTSRICRYIGLTTRAQADGKSALAITESLRRLDPDDPLRYDFPICHLGISGGCIHRRSPEHCPSCPLDPICTLE